MDNSLKKNHSKLLESLENNPNIIKEIHVGVLFTETLYIDKTKNAIVHSTLIKTPKKEFSGRVINR